MNAVLHSDGTLSVWPEGADCDTAEEIYLAHSVCYLLENESEEEIWQLLGVLQTLVALVERDLNERENLRVLAMKMKREDERKETEMAEAGLLRAMVDPAQ